MNLESIDNNRKELIKEIENRLQFVITIAIFFGTSIFYIFKAANKSDVETSNTILPYGLLIALYLIDYFCFGKIRYKIVEKDLEIISTLILFGVLSFTIPIFIFGLTYINFSVFISSILKSVLIISLYVLVSISGLIIFFIRKSH